MRVENPTCSGRILTNFTICDEKLNQFVGNNFSCKKILFEETS